ncbi:endonuclease/exonuclease/phosphatase family protein [Oceaniovalibus sp. ACAM 378]|uniref:endonuclease/exonuclease/phosphatase family protein n=1 Tax=Oceaniovalibus sp. ACAM 378 TaxID=2599923 RepID=UPI0011D5529F|nr:endonuclease/exonuclease/phosphatase family protein [Oceaniovalibus sp. ACAM 378]TYB84532.1 endonuclease/exonuclease/phosphatase family protein [Oceaniovalibus sp. ACAM 378]
MQLRRAMIVVAALLWLLTAVFVTVTVLPLSNSHLWWIRAMDFPRAQYVVAILPVLAVCLAFGFPGRWVVVALLLACLAWQVSRILPYTPIWPKEIRLAPEAAGAISVMSLNVLRENERYGDVIAAVQAEDPDILFLMEINDAWEQALEPLLAQYPSVLRHAKDNHYGLIAATRLPVHDLRIEYLTTDPTPTAFGELEAPGGQVFRFVGLHPQPPVPGVDTKERDAQLVYSARFARDSDVPVIVMGDFNAVVWSDVTRRFKRIGQYLDPRIGRGLLPSFDANHPILRFPIDQLYVTPDIAVVSFARGPYVGSDHFPMVARLRIDPELAATLNRAPDGVDSAELERLSEIVEKHRLELKAIDRTPR